MSFWFVSSTAGGTDLGMLLYFLNIVRTFRLLSHKYVVLISFLLFSRFLGWNDFTFLEHFILSFHDMPVCPVDMKRNQNSWCRSGSRSKCGRFKFLKFDSYPIIASKWISRCCGSINFQQKIMTSVQIERQNNAIHFLPKLISSQIDGVK